MYVTILDEYMNVLTRSEMSSITQMRRKQDDVSSRCHCATVRGRGASYIQVGGGGKQLFVCSAFVTCIWTRVVATRAV